MLPDSLHRSSDEQKSIKKVGKRACTVHPLDPSVDGRGNSLTGVMNRRKLHQTEHQGNVNNFAHIVN